MGVADLVRGHALIGRDRDASFLAALAEVGIRARKRDFALRIDSDAAQLAAVRAGLGIGVCQVPLSLRPPRLRRVLPSVSIKMPAWVVTHEDLRSSRRVSLVFDHLAAALSAYARTRGRDGR